MPREADPARSERLLAAKAAAWQVEPVSRITFAAGGTYRCPDERCGEDIVGIAIPHPDDPSQTPNRCPTCLATVEKISDAR